MRFQALHLLASFVLPSLVIALPAAGQYESREAKEPHLAEPHLRGKRSVYERDGVQRTVFEHEATGAVIDFVTNSGICETTPGVNQFSGYLSVGSKF